MIGDPHISTPDGFKYIFNGLGEYWLVRNDQAFHMQGRTDFAWDANGNPVNTATTFVGFAAQAVQSTTATSQNGVTPPAPSRIEILLDPTRTCELAFLLGFFALFCGTGNKLALTLYLINSYICTLHACRHHGNFVLCTRAHFGEFGCSLDMCVKYRTVNSLKMQCNVLKL